ncbi:hypothetical protein LUD75_12835 [Epilithonimonas sp. JDS]|jgi:hypothetical protein|uniref:hypothetical protein n=1 Tax=Epilithonimonas sp. JDS TaxID=2902797 RepID=UPI001E5F30D3|nr:hypothetical protein [Epilithonimonas sp. JDS]MCD9855603.1 hypothetical protein [Epilithonimonas sp. JDS]
MKKLRDKIEHFVLTTEIHWKALSVEKQRLLTKVFFGGYCLLTVIVIIHVIVSTGQKSNTISIDHIDGISTKLVEKASEQNNLIESPIKK